MADNIEQPILDSKDLIIQNKDKIIADKDDQIQKITNTLIEVEQQLNSVKSREQELLRKIATLETTARLLHGNVTDTSEQDFESDYQALVESYKGER